MFARMKPGSLNLLAALALLAVATTVLAENKPNPYEAIAERNPFGLKPPPPPPDPNATANTPPPPLATVEVTGILSIFSKKKAILEIVPGPGKPALKQTLDEGERLDAIEVVAIDMEKNEVTINNGGTVTNVALKTPAKTAGPAPGGPVPIPPPAMHTAFAPPVNPAAANPYANVPSSRGAPMVAGGTPAGATAAAVPNQPGVSTYTGGAGAYVPHTQPGAYGSALTPTLTGGREVPPRTIRSATPQPVQQQGAQVDPAVQYINMAIQKQQAEQKGRPFPPLPPVPGLDQ